MKFLPTFTLTSKAAMISVSRFLLGSGLLGSGLVATLAIAPLPSTIANAQADFPCYWLNSRGQVINLNRLCSNEEQPPAPPEAPTQAQQPEPDLTLRVQGQVYTQPNYEGPICIYLGRVNGNANVELAFKKSIARIAIVEGSLDRVQAVSADIKTSGPEDTRIIIRADRRLSPRIASEACTGPDVIVTGIEFPISSPAEPPAAAPTTTPERGELPLPTSERRELPLPPPPPAPARGSLPSLP